MTYQAAERFVHLHVGMPKTGTTSLQVMLAESGDWLRSHGIHYPSAGRPKSAPHGHHELAWSIRDMRSVAGNVWDRLLDELRTTSANRFLISAENFAQMRVGQIEQVQQRLDGFRLMAVAYVRDPYDFLASMYCQKVKGYSRYARTFGEFVRDFTWLCDYSDMANRWATVLGRDAVTIRSFEYARSVGIEIDFCDAIGITHDSSAPRVGINNVTPNPNRLAWLRGINRLETQLPGGKLWQPVTQRLRRLSNCRFGDGDRFKSELESLQSFVVEQTRSAAVGFAYEWLPDAHRAPFLSRYARSVTSRFEIESV